MKSLFIIVFILINAQILYAQKQGQTRIDSLLNELTKNSNDTNAVNILSEISTIYYSINPKFGIKYAKDGLKIASKLKWNLGQAKCLNNLAVNRSINSDYSDAVFNFKKALDIYKKLKDKEGIASILGNIGNINLVQSNYSEALDYYTQALKIRETLDNKPGLAFILGNIGSVYHNLSKYNKALEFYNKALNLNKKLGNLQGIASNLDNLGKIYTQQLDFAKALDCFHKVLKLYEELGRESGIASINSYLGNIYSKQKEYDKALEYYHKSLLKSEELDHKFGIAETSKSLGELYLNLSKDTSNIKKISEKLLNSIRKEYLLKSIEHTKRSSEVFREINSKHSLFLALESLSDSYFEVGDFKNALDYYKKSKEIEDSIFSTKNQTKIANLEAKRENELKEKEIVILKKEKENQKLQRYAMFGGIAGLGIIIGLILIQRRKSEKLLLNVLPAKIAKRLKAKEHPIADHFDNASIIFIDLVGFTKMSSSANPNEIVALLNDIFTIFDKLADKHGLEKIKTIGDAYMAVAGIPEIQADHTKRTAQMALDIKSEMKDFKTSGGTEIKFRIGIDCGAVVAGVIGEKKFIYDLWSDAVNTASRMESTGESGQIQITENFKEELEKYEGNWNFTLRGEFEIKGKGLMKTYYLGNKN